jgi:hypothetical protein
MKTLPAYPWLCQPHLWLTELAKSLGSANEAGQHTRTPSWTAGLKRGSSQGLRGALLRSLHSVGSVANCARCSCSHAYRKALFDESFEPGRRASQALPW